MDTPKGSAEVPPVSLPSLLNLDHSPRVFEVCKAIWRAISRLQSRNWVDSFNKLVQFVRRATQWQACTCKGAPECDLSAGWSNQSDGEEVGSRQFRISNCAIYNIWYSIRVALAHGLCAVFIEPGQNAILSISLYHDGADSFITTGIFRRPTRLIRISTLYNEIMRMVEKEQRRVSIACSHGSSTMYPAVLETLSVPTSQSVIFKLVDGQLVFAGRYHRIIVANTAFSRARTQRPLTAGDVRPSHIGAEPNFLLASIREDFEFLTLLCRVQYAGSIMNLNLISVIQGYMVMRWADPCNHPFDDCLNTSKYKAMVTSVAAPGAENAVGVAMTRWNPVAQPLCCAGGDHQAVGGDHQAVLQRDCCLNCALKDIKLTPDPNLVIIVG